MFRNDTHQIGFPFVQFGCQLEERRGHFPMISIFYFIIISVCTNACEVYIVTTNILSMALITQDTMSSSMEMVGDLESSLLVNVFALYLTICGKSSLNLTGPFSFRNSNCSKADYFSSSLKDEESFGSHKPQIWSCCSYSVTGIVPAFQRLLSPFEWDTVLVRISPILLEGVSSFAAF